MFWKTYEKYLKKCQEKNVQIEKTFKKSHNLVILLFLLQGGGNLAVVTWCTYVIYWDDTPFKRVYITDEN